MSLFSISGLSSGIDYNSIISAIMKLERQPVARLQSKQTTFNQKISAYNDLNTKLGRLQNSAETLKTSSDFYVKKAVSSNTDVLDVTASSTSVNGTYSITELTALAQEEKQVHSGVSDKTASINSSGGDLVFKYTYAKGVTGKEVSRSLNIADGTSLNGLVAAINGDADNPGVNATILFDGTDYRLVLTGEDTGADYTITIEPETTLNGTNSVDFTSATFTETKTAQDASFKVDGISVTSASNTVSDVIDGVTLTLNKASASPGESADATISDDSTSIKANIEEFVNAYNDILNFVNSKSSYNTKTNTGSVFSNEATPRGILSAIRSKMGQIVSGLPEDMQSLAQLGITTDSKLGTLTINSTVLDEKLASNADDVYNIFADATDGIATVVYDSVEGITDTIDGSIAVRKSGLQTLIKTMDNDILRMEARLTKMEEDLSRQFASLEGLIGGLNAQSSFLLNQISAWNR